MRGIVVVMLLSCLASSSSAQDTPPTWSLWLGARAVRFSAFATGQLPDPFERLTVRPNRRVGIEAGVDRQIGAWQAGLRLGYAPGKAELRQGTIALTDDLLGMARYRLAASVGRRLVGVDRGQLRLAAGPTIDHWTFLNDARTTLGAEVALALDIPIGGVTLRQSLSLGIAPSPATRESVGAEVDVKRLTTLGFGVALALGL